MYFKTIRKYRANLFVSVILGLAMFLVGRVSKKYLPFKSGLDDKQELADDGSASLLKKTEIGDENTEIVEIVQELEPVPWRYDSQFKNPCWVSGSSLKCIPYFYIVGMRDAGTRFMFHAIMEHPEAVRPGFTEANFFWKKDIADLERGEIFTYVDMYDRAAETIQDFTESQSNPYLYNPLITGDGSTYLTRWWNTTHTVEQRRIDPSFSILGYIFHLVPGAKIIVVFRDPVDRLYAEYCSRAKWRLPSEWPSPEDFHEKVSHAITVYNMMFRFRDVKDCVYNEEGLQLAKFGLLFGLYYYYWEEVIRIFQRKQILVLQYGTLFSEETWRLVFAFLEMEPPGPDVLARIRLLLVGHAGGPCGNRKMLWRTRVLLHSFYEPYNRMMADLMEDDAFLYPLNKNMQNP